MVHTKNWTLITCCWWWQKISVTLSWVFRERVTASFAIAVLSVCLLVRLSHAGIVTKRIKLWSRGLHHPYHYPYHPSSLWVEVHFEIRTVDGIIMKNSWCFRGVWLLVLLHRNRDVGWNFQVWKFHKFREFFGIFQDPLLKFSLKFCILIIIHR